MDEEEAIKRIARLLEMGGTMLASHHECGAPLFRYKGEVVCPVCSFEEEGKPQVTSQAERFAVESREGASKRSGQISATEDEGGHAAGVEERGRKEDTNIKNRGLEVAHGESSTRRGELEDERERAMEEMEAAILMKMREIFEKMRDETDLGRLKSQLEYIKEALEVLESLRDRSG